MGISFERQNGELLLILSPERLEVTDIIDTLNSGKPWHISRCFSVEKMHLRHIDYDNNELQFCVGTVDVKYTLINCDVLGIKHKIYFSNDIKLNKRHFVAYRNISILSKIDSILDSDVYIGGNHVDDHLPIDTFEFLIKKFPKTAELDHYANARISTIVKEHFPATEQYELQFDKYIQRQDSSLVSMSPASSQKFYKENIQVEFHQFQSMRKELAELLDRADSVSEQVWQEAIHGILQLLYPKYIAGIREVVIKGVDRHDKRPDFLLVDANGYIDILEIKKPSVQLLTRQSSYRNNYVPVRELAGAIQQIEKYIYFLNAWGNTGEDTLKKQLSSFLPDSVLPKIVNPQGILLLGRSNQFTRQQRDDFELIKRQYKHIAEIMTYDDLVQRIDNIIASLSLHLE